MLADTFALLCGHVPTAKLALVARAGRDFFEAARDEFARRPLLEQFLSAPALDCSGVRSLRAFLERMRRLHQRFPALTCQTTAPFGFHGRFAGPIDDVVIDYEFDTVINEIALRISYVDPHAQEIADHLDIEDVDFKIYLDITLDIHIFSNIDDTTMSDKYVVVRARTYDMRGHCDLMMAGARMLLDRVARSWPVFSDRRIDFFELRHSRPYGICFIDNKDVRDHLVGFELPPIASAEYRHVSPRFSPRLLS